VRVCFACESHWDIVVANFERKNYLIGEAKRTPRFTDSARKSWHKSFFMNGKEPWKGSYMRDTTHMIEKVEFLQLIRWDSGHRSVVESVRLFSGCIKDQSGLTYAHAPNADNTLLQHMCCPARIVSKCFKIESSLRNGSNFIMLMYRLPSSAMPLAV
jgi:hypothetical protein